MRVVKLGIRFLILFAGVLFVSFLANEGTLDQMMGSTMGRVIYWALSFALLGWLAFGVVPVAYRHFYRRSEK